LIRVPRLAALLPNVSVERNPLLREEGVAAPYKKWPRSVLAQTG
jgi:hypothetical protein